MTLCYVYLIERHLVMFPGHSASLDPARDSCACVSIVCTLVMMRTPRLSLLHTHTLSVFLSPSLPPSLEGGV